jgi:putative Holliday junction resolvase
MMLGMVNGNIIAFDFGTKRIGVAVGQGLTKTGTPLEPISADQGIPNWQTIATLVQCWQPQAFVVGLPVHMDGSEQLITQRTRLFIEALHKRTSLPVYEMDERLTSIEARSQLFAQGGYAFLKKSSVDSFAAKLILEQWFATL